MTAELALERIMLEQNKYRPLVYVCSPYRGDTETNVKRCRAYCKYVVEHGGIPIAPHIYFTQFLDDSLVPERKLGMRFGEVLLDRCAEVWVFGKPSEGMKAEIARANRKRRPVKYFSVDGPDLKAYNPQQGVKA